MWFREPGRAPDLPPPAAAAISYVIGVSCRREVRRVASLRGLAGRSAAGRSRQLQDGSERARGSRRPAETEPAAGLPPALSCGCRGTQKEGKLIDCSLRAYDFAVRPVHFLMCPHVEGGAKLARTICRSPLFSRDSSLSA